MKPLFFALALGIATAPAVQTARAAKPEKTGPASRKTETKKAADTPATPPKDTVDRTQKPAAGPLPTFTFPEATTETLPNGLRVFLLPDHRQPMVTYRLLIKSGDLCDNGKPGLGDLVANLLNKGTKELNADEFAQKTDFLGASVEASSGDDALSITATGLSKYTGALLEFLRDAALKPAFRDGELEQEKVKAISNLVQKKADPQDLAARLRDKLLYGEHPYGAFATPESVRSITRDDLVRFHDTYFVPNNATLVVVGDIDAKEAQARVKEIFGDWKSGTVPPLKLPPFPKVEGVSYHLVDRPASVQSNIVVAGEGVARNNADVPELSVVNSVLGGGFSGRLFANLREKHGYTYGSYSGFSQKRFGGTFSATAQVRNAVTGPAVTEIFNELNRIVDQPIPEAELNLQRNYLAGNFLLSLESARRIAERLQEIDLYGLPEDYYRNYAQRITAVTPEKAAELAKKYIHPKESVVVVVGEAKEVLPQLEKLGKVTVYDTDLKPVEEKK